MKVKICFSMLVAGMIAHTAMAVTITKDPVFTSSIMVNDFSGPENTYTNLRRMVMDSVADGVGNFTYPANEQFEGYGYFNAQNNYDPQVYKSIRLRMYTTWNEFGTDNKPIQVFPYPVKDNNGQVTHNINSRTAFYEVSYDFSGVTPTEPFSGEGIRVDPFNYHNDATNDTWKVDYIMADVGQSRGVEFDSQGDLLRFEPNGIRQITNATINSSIFSGETTGTDPQIHLHMGIGIIADTYHYVEFRVKSAAGTEIKWFWKTDDTGYEGVVLEPAVSNDGEWHTYFLDMTDEEGWAGALRYNRYDPADATGVSFEVDYVRFLSVLPPDPVFGYEKWAGGWGVNIGSETNDYDLDGLSNLYEFGLGGDPTDPSDLGTSPAFAVAEVGGSNVFGYVHPQRSDPDSGLTYSLALATDLVAGSWVTNAGYAITGTNVTGGTLDFVTNATDTVESQKYIRLIIE